MDAQFQTPCYSWNSSFINIPTNAYTSINRTTLIPPYPLEIIIGQINVTATSKTYSIDFYGPQPIHDRQHAQVTMNFNTLTGSTGSGPFYTSSTIISQDSLEIVVLPSVGNVVQNIGSSFDIQAT